MTNRNRLIYWCVVASIMTGIVWLMATTEAQNQRREQACRERGGHMTSGNQRARFCVSDDGRILE